MATGIGINYRGCVIIDGSGCVRLGDCTPPNIDGCMFACCQKFNIEYGVFPAGAAIGGSPVMLDMSAATEALYAFNFMAFQCVSGVLTDQYGGSPTLTLDGSGRWVLTFTQYGVTISFRSIAAVCPPMDPGEWERLSIAASDGKVYILTGMDCSPDPYPALPAELQILGLDQLQPTSAYWYTGASRYVDWNNGHLTKQNLGGSDVFMPSVVPPGQIVTYTLPSGHKVDLDPAYYPGENIYGYLQLTPAAELVYCTPVNHPWNGDIYVARVDSYSFASVPMRLIIGGV